MDTALESPGPVPDTPTEADDGLYPCKGCGEILEEGKAFELAGNRWHIDCFRCNTCGTLLDSDANLLLLGDGSLICNNCTYSCSACGNKIEDLAILTGQEAFCAQCFKCRNCKKKIENLRYARTSQGIFCMQCHESLMARRRKKSRASGRTPSSNSANNSTPTVLDKSLPALPPGAVPAGALAENTQNTQSPASLSSETPTERSPATRHPVSMKNSDLRKETSALEFDRIDDYKENLGLHNDHNGTNRISHLSSRSNGSHAGEEYPITFDNRSRPPPPFRNTSNDNKQPSQGGSRERTRDFGDLVAGSAPRSGSMDRGQGQGSPHIMQQVMPQQSSTERNTGLRRRNGSIKVASPNFNNSSSTSPVDRKPTSPSSGDTSDDHFILSDVPNRARRRSSGSKRGSKASNGDAASPNMTLAGQTEGSAVRQQETFFESTPTPSLPSRNVSARQRSPLSHLPSTAAQDNVLRERPQRTDSLERPQKPTSNQAIPRKQIPRAESSTSASGSQVTSPDIHPPEAAFHEQKAPSALAGKTLTDDAFEPPPRSSSRPTPTAGLSSAAMNQQAPSKHDFTSPREAPQPPPNRHKPNESVSSIQSENFIVRDGGTPIGHGLTYFNDAGEDEFGRMGSDESMDQGMFRKVSKVMRHGRSYSDKGSGSPRFTKSSRNGSIDISSPIIGSGEVNEDSSHLRNQLRHSQQRVVELESEKNALQEQVNGAENIRQVNTELREKRSTMTFLDTQREMIMRELETMTDQLAKAKDAKGPVNIDTFKNEALRDFANKVQRLRDSLSTQIEGLMDQKNKLTDEITNLIQMKEKGNQEYESVQSKNQQLREHNAQLVASIQEMYRNQKAPPGNGLGISAVATTGIHNPAKDRQGSLGTTLADDSSSDYKSNLGFDRSTNVSQISGETEIAGEPARFIEGPRVVDMRKGQVKKFSWKKGSENMAKNVKKGFKGAFASAQAPSQSSLREESFSEPVPYGQLQAGEAPLMGDRPVGQRNGIEANRNPGAQAWGLLGQKGNNSAPRSGSSSAMTQGNPPHELFGSDLAARCEFESRVIPSVITRCIEEVEQRGMDVEGIYRKSGSYSQVKAVQSGFEKDNKFDISDDDLDIHAVTSVLKQYLRKLPTPLISYEAYDYMISAAEAAQERGEGVMIEGCTRAVGVLPEHHKNTLELLMGHLVRVMERERENKMSPSNIAVVFAPTIMRPQSVDREMADMENQRKAVQCLLQHHRAVFGS